MRFTLAQLNKLQLPYEFIDDVDLKDDLIGLEGILDIKSLNVKGKIKSEFNGIYKIGFELQCVLVLECAISLKPVEYEIETSFDEEFSLNENDDCFLINGQTLDTKEAIITNLLINKPVRVIADGESFEDEDDHFEDEETVSNNPFESLKDLL